MEIAFSKSFRKSFKKNIKGNKDLESLFWKKVETFINNPYEKSLRMHKLSGKLKELWSFSIDYDIRVILFFEDKQNKAIFIDFGSHDEVY